MPRIHVSSAGCWIQVPYTAILGEGVEGESLEEFGGEAGHGAVAEVHRSVDKAVDICRGGRVCWCCKSEVDVLAWNVRRSKAKSHKNSNFERPRIPEFNLKCILAMRSTQTYVPAIVLK